jgi:hypothetical protein
MIPQAAGITLPACRDGAKKMIYYRNLAEDLVRIDDLYCSSCISPVRAALQRAAAEKNDRILTCANCRKRWIPDVNIDEAARDWTMVLESRESQDAQPSAVGVLCVDCVRANPDPLRLPAIARLVLSQSRGPIQ